MDLGADQIRRLEADSWLPTSIEYKQPSIHQPADETDIFSRMSYSCRSHSDRSNYSIYGISHLISSSSSRSPTNSDTRSAISLTRLRQTKRAKSYGAET